VRTRGLFFAVVASVSLASTPAGAQNLIQNPSFETGDFAGWQLYGWPGSVSSISHTGAYGVYTFGVNVPGLVEQTISTVPGDVYRYSFWILDRTGICCGKYVAPIWDNQRIDFLTFVTAGQWTQLNYEVHATSVSTIVGAEFAYFGQGWAFDDFALTHVTPEPSTLALIPVGLIGVGIAVKRRRKVA
jgi:hypothetical protein